jgi:hypothetical protein
MGSDGSRHTPEGYASHMREQEAQINQHVQRYAHPNGHVNQDPNQHHKPSHPRQPHFPRHVAVTPGLTTAVRGWSAGWTKGIERKTELVFVGQVPAKGERERARRERLERQGRSMSRGSAGSGSAFSQ